jgi:hypothetical protein
MIATRTTINRSPPEIGAGADHRRFSVTPAATISPLQKNEDAVNRLAKTETSASSVEPETAKRADKTE